MATFLKTTESFVPGARTLAGRYYTTPEILDEERERIFASSWLCVGRRSELAGPGSYVTRTIGRDSVIVLLDRAGTLRAFYNVCRHRGTRLCEAKNGSLHGSIQRS